LHESSSETLQILEETYDVAAMMEMQVYEFINIFHDSCIVGDRQY
jgi:hypothetical protein